jgi:hypothetical protein
MELINKEKWPKILDYLNTAAVEGQDPPYGDGMDAILAAKIDDNGDIVAIGQDGKKILAIKIGDKQASIRLANYSDLASSEAQARFSKNPDTQEQLISSFKAAGDEAIRDWMITIKDVILTADDLPTAKNAIFELYPELSGAEMQVENYLTLASLGGYFEAENE